MFEGNGREISFFKKKQKRRKEKLKSREQEERANVPVYQIVDVIRILIKVVPIMCCVVGGGGDGRCTVGKHISLLKEKKPKPKERN